MEGFKKIPRINKFTPTIIDEEKLIILNMFGETTHILKKSMNSFYIEKSVIYKYFQSYQSYFDKGYKFYIYDLTEANDLNKLTKVKEYDYTLYDILEKFGDSIKIMNNNLKEDKFVEPILFFMSQHWLDHHEYEVIESPIQKHFIYLNRVPKKERVLLFDKMLDNELLQNCFYSFNPNGWVDYLGYTPKHKPSAIESTEEGDVITKHGENFKRASSNYEVMKKYEDAVFAGIITESQYDLNTIFFSEKTTKYLTLGKPFVLYSSPYSLRKLKELGFKTFDKWWDESYDEIEDINERTDALIKTIKQISNFSLDKLISIRKDMYETLIHNHKTIKSIEQTHSEYFKYKLGI